MARCFSKKVLIYIFLSRPQLHFNLEDVVTDEEMTYQELKHLVQLCPNLKKLKFRYSRKHDPGVEQSHLWELCGLNRLSDLSVKHASFFEHQIFHLLEVRGEQVWFIFFQNIKILLIETLVGQPRGSRC